MSERKVFTIFGMFAFVFILFIVFFVVFSNHSASNDCAAQGWA